MAAASYDASRPASWDAATWSSTGRTSTAATRPSTRTWATEHAPPTERPVYRADGQLVNPPSHPPQWAPDLNPYADSDAVDPYANPSSPPRGGAPR